MASASHPPQEQEHEEAPLFKEISTFLTLLCPLLPQRPPGSYQPALDPLPGQAAVAPMEPFTSTAETEVPAPPPKLPPVINLHPPLMSRSTLKDRVEKWMGDAFLDTYLQMSRDTHQAPRRYAVVGEEELHGALVELHNAVEDAITSSEETFSRLLDRMEKRAEEIWDLVWRMSTEPEELKVKLIKFNTTWGIFPPAWDLTKPNKPLYDMYDSVPIRVLFDVDDIEDMRRWMLGDDQQEEEAKRKTQEATKEPYLVLTVRLVGPTLRSLISWATCTTLPPSTSSSSAAQEPGWAPSSTPPLPPAAPELFTPTPSSSASSSSSGPVDQRRESKRRIQDTAQKLLLRLWRTEPTEELRSRIVKREHLIRPTAICIQTQIERILSEERTGRVPGAGFAMCAAFATIPYPTKPLDALQELLINLAELLLCEHVPWEK